MALKISIDKFKKEYKDLISKVKIEDHSYYPEVFLANDTHIKLFNEIRDAESAFSIIICSDPDYGYYKVLKQNMKKLPPRLRLRSLSWAQIYHINKSGIIDTYMGMSIGSGYRHTHGVLAHAFALLSKEKPIPTYVIKFGKRGGISIFKFENFVAYHMDLTGNYHLERDISEKILPLIMRISSWSIGEKK